MADGIEQAGALVTAGAAAHVIEGKTRGRHAPPSHCLNCGTELNGAFCAQCGQRGHLHRSMGDAAHELVHGVLHFDSKLWKTVPLLLFRPGYLTRDYVMGRRVRYISPVALFLLSFFVMFFVFGYVSPPKVQFGVTQSETIAQLDRSIAEVEADLATARLDPKRGDDVTVLKGIHETLVANRARAASGESIDMIESLSSSMEVLGTRVNTGDQKLDGKLQQMLRNPSFMLYKMKQKGYKLGFLLIPLTLPWLWLVFCWRRDVHSYDHVAFMLYSLSFVSLLVIFASMLMSAGIGGLGLFLSIITVVPLVHMFFQLKGAYALGVGGALWRTCVMAVATLTSLFIYVLTIGLLGLLD